MGYYGFQGRLIGFGTYVRLYLMCILYTAVPCYARSHSICRLIESMLIEYEQKGVGITGK